MEYKDGKKEYYSSDHLVYSCQYHVIFCPKYRRPILKSPIDGRLKEIFLSVAEERDFKILDMEVMPDHVHLLIDCNPRYGIMNCVKNLKGCSARLIRTEFPDIKKKLPCLWTRSAFISSVGAVSLGVVMQYIDSQKGK